MFRGVDNLKWLVAAFDVVAVSQSHVEVAEQGDEDLDVGVFDVQHLLWMVFQALGVFLQRLDVENSAIYFILVVFIAAFDGYVGHRDTFRYLQRQLALALAVEEFQGLDIDVFAWLSRLSDDALDFLKRNVDGGGLCAVGGFHVKRQPRLCA